MYFRKSPKASLINSYEQKFSLIFLDTNIFSEYVRRVPKLFGKIKPQAVGLVHVPLWDP